MTRNDCLSWIKAYFHPKGLECPHCNAAFNLARWFRKTKRSDLDVYRCSTCQGIYTLYSQTVFQGRHLQPEQIVLFIYGIRQHKSTTQLAQILHLSRTTITELRQQLQPMVNQDQRQFLFDLTETNLDQLIRSISEEIE